MKKYLILFILPLYFACGPSAEEIMQAKLDSIEAQNQLKDEAINDFMNTVNAVEENLRQIKEKESIISLSASQEGQTAKDRINEDINTIVALMQENKSKVDELEKKLKNSRYQNAQLVKTIETLKKRVEEQNQQIAQLQQELAQKKIVIEGLSEELSSVSKDRDTLTKISAKQQEEIEAKTVALNTAYYVVGTTKELKENKIIDRDGGVLGMGRTSTVSNNVNTSYFTKIDLRTQTKIPVNAAKVVLVSKHPEGSYSWDGTNPVKNLVISDAQQFWSLTKYLVIESK